MMDGNTSSTTGMGPADRSDHDDSAQRVLRQYTARVVQACEKLCEASATLQSAQRIYEESIEALREAQAARQGLRRG